jgi:hypothetical protein
MKYIIALFVLFAITVQCKSQKVYDPCQTMDTNTIKQLIIGTWVDVKDSNHVIVMTSDSVEETIVIGSGVNKKVNVSYLNYKFTDNVFSSDAVTCYSLVEYLQGYPNHTDFAINSVDAHYLLLGSTGKAIYKRRN